MKRRIYLLLIMSICSISICACGKKSSQTLSENIATVNGEIQGMDEINSQIEKKQSEVNYLTSEENELTDENNDSSETEEIIENSNSQNSLVIDNSLSADSLSVNLASENVTEDNQDSEQNIDQEESADITLNEYYANMTINNSLTVSNLSGKDLIEVYASFNVGSINNIEITSGNKLKDGNKIEYVIADIDEIKNSDNIIVSINGVDKKGNTISFGEVRIIDSSNMNIILTKSDGTYSMYIK